MASQVTKRRKVFREHLPDVTQSYSVNDAMSLLQECAQKASTRFTQSVEAAVELGVDPSKSDQVVRGSVLLPHGTGKTVKVAVFAQGAQAEEAKKAGAELVGGEELAQTIQANGCDCDVVIATPDMMGVVGKLGTILGPKGLMPNPKVGTVTQQVAQAVHNVKMGQVRYRTEKAGIVHCILGKIDFENKALCENLRALVEALKKAKPESSKGVYLRQVVVSSTMGPGVKVDLASIERAAV